MSDCAIAMIRGNWNFADTQDPKTLEKNILSTTDSGSIILFHDGGKLKYGTSEAMENVITTLTARGFHFVKVNELLKEKAQ